MPLPIPTSYGGLLFACWECNLNSSQVFEVQEGDIVGIHVNNSSPWSTVHVLGMTGHNTTTVHVTPQNVRDDLSFAAGDDQLATSSYSLYLMAIIGMSCLTLNYCIVFN